MLISVLIAVYNESEHIEKTLLSILSQKKTGFEIEIVVCDDFSIDNTYDIVYSLSKEFNCIKLIKNDFKGKVSAFNNAFFHCSGDFICFFSGDDLMLNNSLFSRFSLFSDNVDVVSGKVQVFDVKLKKYGAIIPRSKTGFSYSGIAPMFRRSVAKQLFPINSKLPNEDTWLKLYLSLFCHDSIVGTGDIVAIWRMHKNNSFNRESSFFSINKALSERNVAYIYFKEKYQYKLSDASLIKLNSLIDLEASRKKGEFFKILLNSSPLLLRVSCIFHSNVIFYKLSKCLKKII